jgi:hypothetical protein
MNVLYFYFYICRNEYHKLYFTRSLSRKIYAKKTMIKEKEFQHVHTGTKYAKTSVMGLKSFWACQNFSIPDFVKYNALCIKALGMLRCYIAW